MARSIQECDLWHTMTPLARNATANDYLPHVGSRPVATVAAANATAREK